MVSQILELAQLVDHHRVPEVQIRRSGVHAELDPQMASGLELLSHLGLDDQLVAAAPDEFQLVVNVAHGCSGIAWPAVIC